MSFRISLKPSQPGSKARAEEDEKAREEEAARKRVLAEFLEEHGDDDNDGPSQDSTSQPISTEFIPQGAKRHFSSRPRSLISGPGTLDQYNSPAQAGPPGRFGNQPQSRFGGPVPQAPVSQAGNMSGHNIYTTVVAKVSNLPPGTDRRKVEELFADYPSLRIARVDRLPPTGPTSKSRPSVTMNVTFAQGVNARDLEDAMNKMNDKKYLGRGYYLHLDRYLGGRVVGEKSKEPFDAQWKAPESKGFAPTADIGGATGRTQAREQDRLVITAYPPPDLPTLKLIHQTVDGVIRGGMEFEAALMEVPRVQNDERWAWLYDQKHPLNRYYRLRIAQMVCLNPPAELFRGEGEWIGAKPLPDEFANKLTMLDPDASDDASEEEEEGGFRNRTTADPYPGYVDSGTGMLSIRSRTFLMYLLTHAPTVPANNSEIAAFAAFAIDHATEGMDEIIHHVINNIFNPYCLTKTNVNYRPNNEDGRYRKQLIEATINALRIVSDIALATHKEGGPSWKYRDAIGTQLAQRQVFEYLETLPQRLGMGRSSNDIFRNSVQYVIDTWKHEVLFSLEVLEQFNQSFNLLRKQKEEEEAAEKAFEKRKRAAAQKALGMEVTTQSDAPGENEDDFVDSETVDEPQVTNPRQQSPESWDSSAQQTVQTVRGTLEQPQNSPSGPKGDERVADMNSPQQSKEELERETAAARARRMRPKAEDMFASDDE